MESYIRPISRRACLLGTPSCRTWRSPNCRHHPSPILEEQMTAIDFAAFVDELASVSGETIRPFFRTRTRHRKQELRPAGSIRLRPPIAPPKPPCAHSSRRLSRTRHYRRGIRRRAPRRRICLDARPDRRHQILYLRHAGLGHADRANPSRRADLRHDAPAVHARALCRRRRGRAAIAARRGSRLARAPLRDARRRGAAYNQPAIDARGRPAPSAGSKRR